MTICVFFPSLMGVGILVSGALLISDWVRRLFPQGSVRRKHSVVVGTYGSVSGAVAAAGYHLGEPWFVRRGLRRRIAYVSAAAISAAMAAASIWAGRRMFNDPLGLFAESPWAIGIGYGFGAALVVFAALCLAIAVAYSAVPKPLMRLVQDTSLGCIVLPTAADHEEVVNTIKKEK